MATLVLTVLITTAISLLASYLMRPKADNPLQDETPSTVASRGAFIPRLLGRRRVGPVVGWVGRHATTKEGGGGGKGSGGGGGSTKIHWESAWHILCVGPGYKLHAILQSGKVIWQGPIERSTTPSGSTVDAGKRGSFRIYWGDVGQPIDTLLNDTNKVDIDSRWEYLCFVVWDRKRLGTSRTWPLIDYDVEVRAEFSALTQSQDWIVTDQVVSTTTRNIYSIYGPGGPYGNNYIEVRNKRTEEFIAGRSIQMSGNVTNADGTYSIISVVWDKFYVRTRIYVSETLTDDIRTFPLYPTPSYKPTGTVAPFITEDNDGVNPAHMIYELLFESYPHGLGFPTTDFSLSSLEALGVLLSEQTGGERFLGGFLAEKGEEALAAIAGIMQDVGCILRWNVKNGRFEFVAIRAPTVTPPHFDEDSLVAPLPEIETLHGARQRSRMMFSFKDRTKNYRKNTVSRDDDSLADFRGHFKTIQVDIPTVINYETAVTVAERRSQEEFGNFATFKIICNKEARALLPGDSLTVVNVDPVLRILETTISPLASRVELACIVDFYGIAASTFTDEVGGGDTVNVETAGATPFQMVEVPAFLKTAPNFDVVVPYLRTDEDVDSGIVWFSRDNSTYQQVHNEQGLQTGGELREAIPITDPTFITTGPEFELVGPDIGEVLDLTGDDTNWRLGRQLAIINGEIFYCKKITAVSGTIYRADGLIRARYDTVKEAHAVGDSIFIFTQRNITWFDDLLLIPEETLYVKVQPSGTNEVELADVGEKTYTLHGKGIVPMDCKNLRTENMINEFATGADIPLKWAYMSADYLNASAGLQASGAPHSAPPIPGEFVLRFRTTGDVLMKEISAVKEATYTIDNADLVSWFSGEPSSFKVAVSLVQSGYESDELEITITRI